MFSSIQHFTAIWESETASTLSCLEHLTDESLSKDLVSDYRTIDRLVNHIVDCAASIPYEAGLPVEGYLKQHYMDMHAIIEAYKKNTDAVKQALSQWTDATLQEETPMYEETWKKGFALWVTVVHQIHHRGQLTTLMRAAGLKVPGVYGPAKEEWEAMAFLPKAD
ncbi:MAG: DinB family protein [Bacteroidota bacterium]